MKIVNVALACMSILTISISLVTAQTGVAVAKPARAAHAQPGVVAMPHRFSATSSESADNSASWNRSYHRSNKHNQRHTLSLFNLRF